MTPETATIACPVCAQPGRRPCRRVLVDEEEVHYETTPPGVVPASLGGAMPFIHNRRAARQAYDPEFIGART